jgi:probable HAF family extracellular repeat protein
MFGSFMTIIIALLCVPSLWRVKAQEPMEADMDMRSFFRPVGMAGALVNDDSVANPGPDSSYIRLDFPNAVLTVAYDINNSGDVVGFYEDTNLEFHGFVYDPATGAFTSIDYPNPVCTTGTDARGINERGDIVGTCTDDAGNFYAYLRNKDGFTSVSNTDHMSTIAQGISSDGGHIVGCIHDTNMTTTMFGMSLDTGGFSFFGGAYGGLVGRGFMNNGITPGGEIVAGLFTDTSVSPARGRAYIVREGLVTPFDYPNAAMTAAWDVNAQGDVVGVRRDPVGRIHGFLRSAQGEFTSIDFPGATLTRAFGINTNSEIVGTYVEVGLQHAFIYRPQSRRH